MSILVLSESWVKGKHQVHIRNKGNLSGRLMMINQESDNADRQDVQAEDSPE